MGQEEDRLQRLKPPSFMRLHVPVRELRRDHVTSTVFLTIFCSCMWAARASCSPTSVDILCVCGCICLWPPLVYPLTLDICGWAAYGIEFQFTMYFMSIFVAMAKAQGLLIMLSCQFANKMCFIFSVLRRCHRCWWKTYPSYVPSQPHDSLPAAILHHIWCGLWV